MSFQMSVIYKFESKLNIEILINISMYEFFEDFFIEYIQICCISWYSPYQLEWCFTLHFFNIFEFLWYTGVSLKLNSRRFRGLYIYPKNCSFGVSGVHICTMNKRTVNQVWLFSLPNFQLLVILFKITNCLLFFLYKNCV